MFQSVKDWITNKWQYRFIHGFTLLPGRVTLMKYTMNRGWFFDVKLGRIESIDTAHHPFSLFELTIKTGPLNAWHCMILGVTFGVCIVPDLDEEGNLQGPDQRKSYCFFSCINHQNQTVGEIINHAK